MKPFGLKTSVIRYKSQRERGNYKNKKRMI